MFIQQSQYDEFMDKYFNMAWKKKVGLIKTY